MKRRKVVVRVRERGLHLNATHWSYGGQEMQEVDGYEWRPLVDGAPWDYAFVVHRDVHDRKRLWRVSDPTTGLCLIVAGRLRAEVVERAQEYIDDIGIAEVMCWIGQATFAASETSFDTAWLAVSGPQPKQR